MAGTRQPPGTHAAPGTPARATTASPRLSRDVWRERERRHQDRADALTLGHRERKQRGQRHPVEDFLWTYYSVKPSELRRWHPGADLVLEHAQDRATWRYYAIVDGDGGDEDGGAARIDLDAFFARRASTVDYVETLLRATLDRTPQFGCFGLHEWAMVYRLGPEQVRHAGLPLRIGHAETDAVVASHRIACSHFDAYRFFTPEAVELNTLRPTREAQPAFEQSACLHAGMDVYKWAAKLGPIIPGEILLDAFVLARDIREVDMRASPYDVRGYFGADGRPLEPIPIETADGKRSYAALQRGFADRGNALRLRTLEAIATARAAQAREATRGDGA